MRKEEKVLHHIKDEVIALRREFHQYPELGMVEKCTSEKQEMKKKG